MAFNKKNWVDTKDTKSVNTDPIGTSVNSSPPLTNPPHTHGFTGTTSTSYPLYQYPPTTMQPGWVQAVPPTVAPPSPSIFDQTVQDYVDEVDEVAELLGVDPGGKGIQVMGKSGKSYSLLAIIKSHLDLMQQLHILAVHTKRLDPPNDR